MSQPKKVNTMSNDKYHDHEVRITRLEVIVENINKTLERIEKRLDVMDCRIDSNFKWLLGIIIGGFGSMLAIMAHGFHWL